MIPWINPNHRVEPDIARREDQILVFLDVVVYPADAHAPPAAVTPPEQAAPSLCQPGAVHVRVLVGAFAREPTPTEAGFAVERGLSTEIGLLERHFGARYRSAILGIEVARPGYGPDRRALTLIERTTAIAVTPLAETPHWRAPRSP